MHLLFSRTRTRMFHSLWNTFCPFAIEGPHPFLCSSDSLSSSSALINSERWASVHEMCVLESSIIASEQKRVKSTMSCEIMSWYMLSCSWKWRGLWCASVRTKFTVPCNESPFISSMKFSSLWATDPRRLFSILQRQSNKLWTTSSFLKMASKFLERTALF